METNITILKPFFENPEKEFYIRELSRILKINHTTIRQKLNKLVKEGFLTKEETHLTSSYKMVLSQKWLNLKLYYNLEKLHNSKLIEKIQREYDFPIIVLFGSYSKASDDSKSDLDLCIISNIKKRIEKEEFEKNINRKISLHFFTKEEFDNTIKKNKGLINNICNGIVISGELEVIK